MLPAEECLMTQALTMLMSLPRLTFFEKKVRIALLTLLTFAALC